MISVSGSPANEILYHKLDLMQQRDSSIETCGYFGTVSVKGLYPFVENNISH